MLIPSFSCDRSVGGGVGITKGGFTGVGFCGGGGFGSLFSGIELLVFWVNWNSDCINLHYECSDGIDRPKA